MSLLSPWLVKMEVECELSVLHETPSPWSAVMGCRIYLAITLCFSLACVLLTLILLLNGSLRHVTDPSLEYVQCLETGDNLFLENN